MRTIITGFILLLLMPFMTALVIDETTITMKIFPVSTIPNWTSIVDGVLINPEGIIFRVEFSDDEFGNDENYTFVLQPNITSTSSKSFDFNFIKNETIDTNTFTKYLGCLKEKTQCEIDKGKLDISYTICNVDLTEYEEGNISKAQANLGTCNLVVKEKDFDITTKQKEIDDLEKEAANTKNSKWFYALIALVIGASGMHFYRENKSGGTARDKSVEEWPKQQAG